MTKKNTPDPVSESHDQPNPLEVQPCGLERRKQEPEILQNL